MSPPQRIAHALAERIACPVTHHEGVYGTLRFFGRWFGAPMDNGHVLTRAWAEGDVLLLSFHEAECLRVWNPAQVVFEGRGFTLLGADRVRWNWYSYGRPRLAENLRELAYALEPGGLRVREDGTERVVPASDRAVRLISW